MHRLYKIIRDQNPLDVGRPKQNDMDRYCPCLMGWYLPVQNNKPIVLNRLIGRLFFEGCTISQRGADLIRDLIKQKMNKRDFIKLDNHLAIIIDDLILQIKPAKGRHAFGEIIAATKKLTDRRIKFLEIYPDHGNGRWQILKEFLQGKATYLKRNASSRLRNGRFAKWFDLHNRLAKIK